MESFEDRTDEQIDEFLDNLINYYAEIPTGVISDDNQIEMRDIVRGFLNPPIVVAK